MHIPDGTLSLPVLAATGAAAAGAVAVGLKRTDYENIPRVGVMSSVFFVASLIHVPIGPVSAHLLLPGLMGLTLGWAAFPALAAALFLQALLFGFGGMTSLGANILVMGIPAVFCHHVFGRYIRAFKNPESAGAIAFAAGASGIVIAWFVLGLALVASGREYAFPAFTVLLWHIPIVAIEGFVTASAVSFLHRIRPAALGVPFGAVTPLEAD